MTPRLGTQRLTLVDRPGKAKPPLVLRADSANGRLCLRCEGRPPSCSRTRLHDNFSALAEQLSGVSQGRHLRNYGPASARKSEPRMVVFVALQDISEDMGPTEIFPGTHGLEALGVGCVFRAMRKLEFLSTSTSRSFDPKYAARDLTSCLELARVSTTCQFEPCLVQIRQASEMVAKRRRLRPSPKLLDGLPVAASQAIGVGEESAPCDRGQGDEAREVGPSTGCAAVAPCSPQFDSSLPRTGPEGTMSFLAGGPRADIGLDAALP